MNGQDALAGLKAYMPRAAGQPPGVTLNVAMEFDMPRRHRLAATDGQGLRRAPSEKS
jgi:hypothetical protein